MESLHLSADGCLLMSQTIRVTLLHPDPAHRSLDWSAQHEKKFLFEGIVLYQISMTEVMSHSNLLRPLRRLCFNILFDSS